MTKRWSIVPPNVSTSEAFQQASQTVDRGLRPRKFFMVALEESGDRLGAALIRALRERTGGATEISGVGGRGMTAAGVSSLFPIDDLSVIGFTAIPKRLPTIVRRMRETVTAIRRNKPDVLILVDSPTFNLPLARRVRRIFGTLPIVSYVSPPIWAWRFNRARSMRPHIDRVLALLPFEPAEYEKRGGPACTYVGHPLISEAASLRPNEIERRRRDAEPARLLLMPGSRTEEVARLLPLFGAAIEKIAGDQPLELLLPTFPHLAHQVQRWTSSWAIQPKILVEPLQKREAIRTSRAALTKSGTNTLELALASVPMVIAYRLSGLEAFVLRRLVKSDSYTLPNLLLREKVVPELIHDNCSPERLAAELLPLLADTPARRSQLDGFSRLSALMQTTSGTPATQAADEILRMVRR